MKRVTIKDIAKIAGVSCATISRALNNSPEINTKTQARIQEICRQEGYHPNSLARSLVSNHTGVIGLILPNISNPFYGELALDLETCARKQGYSVMMCNSLHELQQTAELLQLLISQQVEGIIIADSHDDTYQYIASHPFNIPLVLLGEFSSPNRAIACNMVSLDNYAAGRMATEYLFSLGHHNIAYLGSQSSSTPHVRRCYGYTDTMKNLGLKPHILQGNTPDSTLESGAALARELLDSGYPYTAVLAATDTIAMGVMETAKEKKLQIPDDFSLIGVDNCTFSHLPGTMLTTVDQRKLKLAEASIDLLMEAIEQGTSAVDFIHRIFHPILVERSTCSPVK